MMKLISCLGIILLSCINSNVDAFTTVAMPRTSTTSSNRISNSRQNMIPPEMFDVGSSGAVIENIGNAVASSPTTEALTSAASSMLLSTIDADIAKMSDNEFAPVFAGGIIVMFGGVASALIVGTILKVRGSYGQMNADSYRQISDGLKTKTKSFRDMTPEQIEEEMIELEKMLKAAMDGKDYGNKDLISSSKNSSNDESKKSVESVKEEIDVKIQEADGIDQPSTTQEQKQKEPSKVGSGSKEIDIFNDYDD